MTDLLGLEDDSFDDSDLVPLFARQQLASQQSAQQKEKPSANEISIVLLDDDEDKDGDDHKKDVGTTPKRKSPQPPPKKSPKKSSVEVIILESDEEEEISSSPPKETRSPSSEKEFTALKKKVPSPPQSSPTSNGSRAEPAEPYWDPFGDDFAFEDQFLPLLSKRKLPQTPAKMTTINKSLLIRSTKKMLSGKKPKKFLKTSSNVSTTTVSVAQKKTTKKRSLFTSTVSKTTVAISDHQNFITSSFQTSTSTSVLPSIRNKEEAISHLTLHFSSSYLHDLLSGELERLADGGKRLKVKVEEEDEDDHLLPTIFWTTSPSLLQLLQTIGEIKGAVKTVVGGKSNLLDQILVFISADELHSCVARFLARKSESDDDENDDNDDDLFELLLKITRRKGAANFTLIIFGLEAYLKGQQRRANRQFRRQLEDLMAAEDQTQQKKRRQRKKNSIGDSAPKVDLNLDNIELTLTDVRMRLHFLQGGESGASSHFTVQFVDTAEQLAALLWRYSRSLAESVWRLSARRSSALAGDLFAEGNPVNSIDPALGRGDLWRRQLQQFHGISASAAETIACRWPSPRALYRALRAAPDPVGLLADTPLSNSNRRTVGEELATKIATYMLTSEGGRLLKSGNCKT